MGVIIVSPDSIGKFRSFSNLLAKFSNFIRLKILGFNQAVSFRCEESRNRVFFSLVRFTSQFRVWSKNNCLFLSIFIFQMGPMG